MSKLEVKEITPISGETDLTLGQSGGTVTLAGGATAVGFGGGGALLQAVTYNQQINTSTSSGSYVDTGISLSITPTSSSSYIVYSILIPLYGGKNTPMRLLLDGSAVSYGGVSLTYSDTVYVTFSGVYTNTSTAAKTWKVQWYRASSGSSNNANPMIGGAAAFGASAPAWPHVNHTTGYLLEFER